MATTVYADFADVTARAGRWQQLFQVSGSHPDQADVEQLLTDCSAEVDTAIRARGFTPATLDTGVLAAFTDVVAYGALSRALASVPDSPNELEQLLGYARSVWGAAMGDPTAKSTDAQRGSISTGTFPAIAALEAGVAGGGSGPGIFQADEPDYGTDAQIESEASQLTEQLAPAFAKAQVL